MTLLALEQATLGYHRCPLLRDVSFSLPAGSLCCLLGANGSGKTTLMRSLLGILPLLKGARPTGRHPVATPLPP
ncbi:ABC-type transporter ATP-binding protein EcsA [Edwardsiella tarda]|nr:ABC-type transporter ATP-binding protein EcsA [Edwardsiella tarda]